MPKNTDMKSDIPVIIRKDEINITEFEEVGYSLAYIHSTLVDHAVLKQFIMLVGIVLIINGALNLWIAVTATRAARDYRRCTETVDTEFVENEGDRDETDGI